MAGNFFVFWWAMPSVNRTTFVGSFPGLTAFRLSLSPLPIADIGRVAAVCKAFHTAIFKDPDNREIWENLYRAEGIPYVLETPDHPRNRQEDFKILYQKTVISGRIIGEYLGKVAVEIPPISAGDFERLITTHFLKTTNSGYRVNLTAVVVPGFVQRTVSYRFPFELDVDGTLVRREGKCYYGKVYGVLNIPYTRKNLMVLAEWSLKNGGQDRFFNFQDSHYAFIYQNDTFLDKARVYFMETKVLELCPRLNYPEQLALLKEQGLDATPLFFNIHYCCLKILRSGSCPHGSAPRTMAMSPDLVKFTNPPRLASIGAYVKGKGMIFEPYLTDMYTRYAVVPGYSPGSMTNDA